MRAYHRQANWLRRWLIGALAWSTSLAATPLPPGFEAWGEPQTTLVDLYYGGQFIEAVSAEYDLTHLRFLAPGSLAEALPGIADPQHLEQRLAQPLPHHADLVCVHAQQPDCGQLGADTLGVIFDESRLRADLFLPADLLAPPPPITRHYHPPPPRQDAGWVQHLSLLASGTPASDQRLELLARSRLGLYGGHAFSDWGLSAGAGSHVERLGYHYHSPQHDLRLGLFERSPRALRLLPYRSLLGMRLGLASQRRSDPEAAIATPIELFLPMQSRVDILRDGRLLSSEFLEAGHQRLDTQPLPLGAYRIDIAITDLDGRVSHQHQHFVKSHRLAPNDTRPWYVELGLPTRHRAHAWHPSPHGAPLLLAGLEWRHRPWLGLGLASVIGPRLRLGEGTVTLMGDGWHGRGELQLGEHGTWGVGYEVLLPLGPSTLSLTARQIDAPSELSTDSLLPQARRSWRLQWRQPLGTTSLTLNLAEHTHATGPHLRRHTLGLRHQRPGPHPLTLTAELGTQNGEGHAQFGLRWQWGSNERRLTGQLSWQDDDPHAIGITADHHGEEWQYGLDLQQRADHASIAARLGQEGGYGTQRLALLASDSPRGRNYHYRVSHHSSFAMGADGISWGRPGAGEGALVVDLRQADPQERFDILLNGQPTARIRGGRRLSLPVTAYQRHRLALIDRGPGFSEFDPQPRETLAYPGHVSVQQWRIQPARIVLGRLWGDTEPLAGVSLISDIDQALTEEDGYFQIRVGELDSLRATTPSCRIDLERYPLHEGIIRANRLHCQP
ncbi:TcfC E-set like domain-containing protein [Halomonas sp. 328]|uniref:TcfC E-set like domain-containing protein n=1 Tax=Halomonas sp. 328 TaxID=2776704 RepID=UPI0018A71121|nr:TcfC E-set like domain-containing protein [Halomonas sp. 328]MBF8224187.1 TcfC E-set like domain-containing protein [Halomonas sp. 328]